MSLEAKIEALTAAVDRLNATMSGQHTPTHVATPAPVAAPVAPPVPAPTPMPVPVPSPMPAPPTFIAPPAPTAAVPQAQQPVSISAAPFTDAKGMRDYVMASYTALGPEKGARIQQVLNQIGASNINDVQPGQYAALYANVEALKVAAC